ncbi:MAG: DUF3012 domain-containing protein [Gammaproteobacteria bacterium]|jgi:hypothetical protein|nr:DUF3012 domain-containing protein [Gammaproteobacteria bacterium]
MKKIVLLILLGTFCLAACEPEVGSPAWCEKMDKTSKADWTANQAADYMKYCVLEQERH